MRAFHWLVMLLQVEALVALAQQSEARAQQLNLQQLREATCNGSTPRIVNEPSTVVVPGTQVDAERSRATVATPPNATAAGADAAPPETPLRPSLPGEETEFQIYVENTVGHEPPLFGHKFFTTAPTTFAPLARVAVPAGLRGRPRRRDHRARVGPDRHPLQRSGRSQRQDLYKFAMGYPPDSGRCPSMTMHARFFGT
jgi:hypothetical protein